MAEHSGPATSADRRGSLAIVGTGIAAISQMTIETIGCIERADVVFYHVTNGPAATHIRKLNPNAVDLYEYYGEGKKRKATYIEMAELMLREVRRGFTVVGVFHGHPGYFVSPARRALAIASLEGYETAMLPGVSAPDCMFADLRVDPGVFGCQILMASRVFQSDAVIAHTGHVVFLQVGAVGDSGFSFSGYKHATLPAFFEKLVEIYGEHQDSIYYMASIFPGFDPLIAPRKLADYRSQEALAGISAGILYLPPKGLSVSSLQAAQSFAGGEAYGAFESKIVHKLDDHTTPPEYRLRRASEPLFAAMMELGKSAHARELYRRSPREFVSRFPALSQEERSAMQRRNIGAVRAASTVVWSEHSAHEAPFENKLGPDGRQPEEAVSSQCEPTIATG